MAQNADDSMIVLSLIWSKVAFGASARETERGKSLEGFIRHGQPSCLVQLTLRNFPKEDAYRPDVYGDRIIIERRISSSASSGYSIKGADEKKVSNQRQELVKILDHYNIQVDNPCSVPESRSKPALPFHFVP